VNPTTGINPVRRELLTRDEAHRIAAIFAKLPEFSAQAGCVEDNLEFRLLLIRQLLRLVSSLASVVNLKTADSLGVTVPRHYWRAPGSNSYVVGPRQGLKRQNCAGGHIRLFGDRACSQWAIGGSGGSHENQQ
jgi:hypothetical protein